MDIRLTLVLIILILSISCENRITLYRENEPNNNYNDANSNGPIAPEREYRGTISSRNGGECDVDVYLIDAFRGRLYSLNFSTDNSDFHPAISMYGSNGPVKGAYLKGGYESRLEFISPSDDYIYLIVGDERNIENSECVGDKTYSYSFTLFERDPCSDKSLPISSLHETLRATFKEGEIASFTVPEMKGIFGIKAVPESEETDLRMTLVNCVNGAVLNFADDIDPKSGVVNPYIYRSFAGEDDLHLFVDNWLADFRKPDSRVFDISTILHDTTEELEPNNLSRYANFLHPEETEGELSSESILIGGKISDDVDIFRRDVIRGEISKFSLILPEGGDVAVTIEFVSSLSGFFPVRSFGANNIVPGGQIDMDIVLPQNGIIFISLAGKGASYKIRPSSDFPSDTMADEGNFSVSTENCASAFVLYSKRKNDLKSLVRLTSDNNSAVLNVYEKDGTPIATGVSAGSLFSIISESDKTVILEGISTSCDETATNEFSFRSETSSPVIVDWLTNRDKTVIEEGTLYKGFLDSSAAVLKNEFNFTAEREGFIHIQTHRWDELSPFPMDTFLEIRKSSGESIVSNDDMDSIFRKNKYSSVGFDAKKGESYTVIVSPYMVEGVSDPTLMNIYANYILDINYE